MIVSDLASPAEVITRHDEQLLCFAQAGNRLPLFGIMRYSTAIITSEALTIAVAVLPALSPSSSAASLVIEAVMMKASVPIPKFVTLAAPSYELRNRQGH